MRTQSAGALAWIVPISILSLAAAFAPFGPAAGVERRALVIGVDSYDNLPEDRQLRKAVNDARAVGLAFESVGFVVDRGENVDRKAFLRLWAKFKSALSAGDVAALYYSGHAVELGGSNFLVPRDVERIAGATEEAEALLKGSSISLDDLLSDLRDKRLQVSLEIIDACRENPFADSRGRSIGGAKGLGRIPQTEGNFIMYSAEARQEALDRLSDMDPNPNSIYTRVLLPLLVQPGLSLPDMARRARVAARDLAATVGRKQTPAYYDGLTGDFYLAGQGSALAPDKSETAALALPAKPPVESAVRPAVGIWEPSVGPKVGETFRDCADCPEMVVVPAGSFLMGSPEDDPGRSSDEKQHRVTIGKPFAVGKYAVTFDEWDACVAAGGCNGYRPSDGGWGRGLRPVINVSWDDAQAYVQWLSRKTRKQYRLPSEAEREYFTRAGTTTPFWWGRTITPQQANYDGAYEYAGGGGKGENRQKTVPVNSFAPNPWGLYQVHGNVYEWVQDCWNETYKEAPKDGSAWMSGDCSRYVLRGGSWLDYPGKLRSALRSRLRSGSRSFSFGLRLARTL